ncbi:PREDICTED: uncharacterized protein LOC106117768 [Papilio xuthus]|uniref:Uncharacterized protein LOC106117768 n=1 Tax=Papilio xuthus TaxID=66420 RepID=A0A194Q210_PAPXU|nr:PREDICTED: uncharacterized protein LOC106117768 [Papilio xuthus]KPI99034.1 hypothetical protein RR46_10352 [Papilio xuthus]
MQPRATVAVGGHRATGTASRSAPAHYDTTHQSRRVAAAECPLRFFRRTNMADPDVISNFNPLTLIEEVKKRPGLYEPDHPRDRLERLKLWKEVGAALFPNWSTFNKATMYHAVLQIQRKWRSLRDAYNRELRSRRSGVRVHRRVYIYFKKMTFLGGFEGSVSEDDNTTSETPTESDPFHETFSPLSRESRKKKKKAPISNSDESQPPEEFEMPVFNNVEIPNDVESDADKLFLLSFVPEMRQLPSNIKMWTRAQIANIMQEAVSCHYSNLTPGTSTERNVTDVKPQRSDSIE